MSNRKATASSDAGGPVDDVVVERHHRGTGEDVEIVDQADQDGVGRRGAAGLQPGRAPATPPCAATSRPPPATAPGAWSCRTRPAPRRGPAVDLRLRPCSVGRRDGNATPAGGAARADAAWCPAQASGRRTPCGPMSWRERSRPQARVARCGVAPNSRAMPPSACVRSAPSANAAGAGRPAPGMPASCRPRRRTVPRSGRPARRMFLPAITTRCPPRSARVARGGRQGPADFRLSNNAWVSGFGHRYRVLDGS